ncbi:MAG: metal ABC transporter substrate-binding protein [Bacillota bacterium]
MCRFFFWAGICLIILLPAGCAVDKAADTGAAQTVNVVTTVYPLADIVKQLGGERVAVSCLLPAGASPHTYEPTVEQAKLIAEAQLFVFVGAGLDEWALKLTEAADRELSVVKLADHLDLLEPGQYHHLNQSHEENTANADYDREDHAAEQNEHVAGAEPGPGYYGHIHGPADPHFWLDPLLVRDKISPRLYEELAALSPEHEAYFEKRLDEFRRQLNLLHQEIAAAVTGFSKHDFIAFHSAWRYFARRYGLHEAAVVAEFPGQEPSAGWVAELVELVGDDQIGAILTEPQFSPALAERIAAESGIKVLVVDPLGGENLPGRETYLEMMRFNLSAFKEALE